MFCKTSKLQNCLRYALTVRVVKVQIGVVYEYLISLLRTNVLLCWHIKKVFIYRKDSEDSTKKGPKSGGRVAIGVTVFYLCRVICVIFSTNCYLFATKYEIFDFWLLHFFFAKSWLL